jgi:hypothetical protein
MAWEDDVLANKLDENSASASGPELSQAEQDALAARLDAAFKARRKGGRA